MKKMLLIFSHNLTAEQKEEALSILGCSDLVPLPPDLQSRWSNVDPSLDCITDNIDEIVTWILNSSEDGDYLLVEGDFGMTFAVVSWALDNNRIAVYSTTERSYSNRKEKDGTFINIHRFKHVKFRRYTGLFKDKKIF